MRDYGKVFTSIWASTTFRSMSEDGRALALYLLTCPHGTITGAFRMPDGYVCEDLQWGSERVQEGFAELFRNGFANRCEASKWVWVCKYLEWNQPENPNQRKAAAKLVNQIPDECSWKPMFMRVCGPSLGLEPPENHNPSGTVPEPLLNQEQEQEQEQEIPPASQVPPAAAGPKPTTQRGRRLPDDWDPGDSGRSFAEQQGLRNGRLSAELARFRDHWAAATGQGATKLDWQAAWRNWVRRAVELGAAAGARGGQAGAHGDPFAGAL